MQNGYPAGRERTLPLARMHTVRCQVQEIVEYVDAGGTETECKESDDGLYAGLQVKETMRGQ
ncbi:hypothetical protein D3C71_1961700 [compost metagenome]